MFAVTFTIALSCNFSCNLAPEPSTSLIKSSIISAFSAINSGDNPKSESAPNALLKSLLI
jgi:hypothetical protein